LGHHLSAGTVVALYGELGSGKTCLTQGIAVGLEVPQSYYVTSPTFAIVNEYPGRIPLFHMDFYRLTDISELHDMGIDEFLYADGVAVIEWAEKFSSVLPEERLDLSFSILDDQKRALLLYGHGKQADVLVKTLCNH
jgi:tRNA threonylcarbamoyladenosine biosynthesis protein TsaE